MKEERLFKIIGHIDENLIENAEYKKNSKHKFLKKWCALAACAVFTVGLGIAIYQNNTGTLHTSSITNGKPNTNLPMITIDTEFGGGMGFEGYMAYDINELVNENPRISANQITHLPVFDNTLTYNLMQKIEEPDIKAMESLLKETAFRLGMDAENLVITYVPPDEETRNHIIEELSIDCKKVPECYFGMCKVFMEDNNIKVEVDNQMVVTIRFNPPVLLPQKYTFTHNSTYTEKYNVAEYLLERYNNLINMKKPKINVTGGDYTFDGNQMFRIEYFEDSDDDLQKIINYNFNYVTFACDDEGKLSLARVYKPDLSQKLGDYPIINEEKAIELLKNKNYITTVSEEYPGEEFIRKIELIYRTNCTEKVFIPYYRIYIELPTIKRENGLNTYGIFYVPAIKGEYIENMPLWDGSFN